jgi:hypothetical protein
VNQATGVVTTTSPMNSTRRNPSPSRCRGQGRSPLIAIDKFSPDRTWFFDVDANFVVASDPRPPPLVNDRLATLSVLIGARARSTWDR